MAVRDFTQAQESSFIENEGVYPVVVTKVEETTSKSGKAMDNVTVVTNDGAMATIFLVYTERTMGMIKGQLKTLGVDLDSAPFDMNQLVGRQGWVKASKTMEDKKDAYGNIVGKQESKYLDIRFTKAPEQSAAQNVAPQAQPIAQPIAQGVAPTPQTAAQPVQQPQIGVQAQTIAPNQGVQQIPGLQ